jgi:hypothetical protein
MAFMTRIPGAAALGAAMLIGAGLSAPPAQAGYIMMLEQAGGNVVATGSGTLDITDLTNTGTFASIADMAPSLAFIDVGQNSTANIIGEGHITGPSNFGPGGEVLATTGTGNFAGVCGNTGCGGGTEILVPLGYVSDSPLSGSATWDAATFASLGVTAGTYTWTWGTGPHADTFTLEIGAVNVSEPASLALLAVGLVSLGMALRRRRTA